MNSKFLVSIFVVAAALSGLIYSASSSTAKAVTTVAELVSEKAPRNNIRLGAKVADSKIEYKTEPKFVVRFVVKDIQDEPGLIPVVYNSVMPDTLTNGRDVILEGDFDGETFHANSLLTQCPSKYEPPVPGEDAAYDEPNQSYGTKG